MNVSSEGDDREVSADWVSSDGSVVSQNGDGWRWVTFDLDGGSWKRNVTIVGSVFNDIVSSHSGRERNSPIFTSERGFRHAGVIVGSMEIHVIGEISLANVITNIVIDKRNRRAILRVITVFNTRFEDVISGNLSDDSVSIGLETCLIEIIRSVLNFATDRSSGSRRRDAGKDRSKSRGEGSVVRVQQFSESLVLEVVTVLISDSP